MPETETSDPLIGLDGEHGPWAVLYHIPGVISGNGAWTIHESASVSRWVDRKAAERYAERRRAGAAHPDMPARFANQAVAVVSYADDLLIEGRLCSSPELARRNRVRRALNLPIKFFEIDDDGDADYTIVARDRAHALEMIKGIEFGDPSRPFEQAVDIHDKPLELTPITMERAAKLRCRIEEGEDQPYIRWLIAQGRNPLPLSECDVGDWFCSEW